MCRVLVGPEANGTTWQYLQPARDELLRGIGQSTFEPLPRRWVVERTFSWINRCRRTVRDYQRHPTITPPWSSEPWSSSWPAALREAANDPYSTGPKVLGWRTPAEVFEEQLILPGVSLHLAGQVQLLRLDAQPIERISDLLARQHLHGTNATFAKWIANKGAVVPLTYHVNEQFTWVTEGRAEVYSQGRKYIMNAGDFMIIPPNVPREFIFLEDSIDIDIFAPGRQDWIDKAATRK